MTRSPTRPDVPTDRRRTLTGWLYRAYWRVMQQICCWVLILGYRIRVWGAAGVPTTGGVLLVSNHQSFFDPVLATVALPRHCGYMARESLFHNAFFRRLIESLHAFPVRRGEADLRAVKETLRRLKGGWPVVLFPEGTRSAGGVMGPIHPGVATLAKRAGVPVVPVAICGAGEAWPRHRKWPAAGTILVKYGRPIGADELAGMEPEQIVVRVRGEIQSLMDDLESIRRWRERF